MSDDSFQNSHDGKLVRPKEQFQSLLKLAGATKEELTMKEVMFYLGQYIMQKQLYDPTQQHIVRCSHDALGQVLGVATFSVKEPRVLFSMITKNLIVVKSQESQQSDHQTDRGTMETAPDNMSVSPGSLSVSPDSSRRRRRSSRRNTEQPGPSCSVEAEEEEEEEEDDEGRKRRRSDSFSLTFDDSLSWCVIGGLGHETDLHVQSPDTCSTVSDNFSVEFEVESMDSDNYSDEETSLSGDDQVYEVTIVEADDDSDEDTEITEADYWRCSMCEELNPPLPRNCKRCWALRQDWLPELSVSRAGSTVSDPKVLPPKPSVDQSAAGECPEACESEGMDVPDGKRGPSPSPDPRPSSSSKLLPPASPLLPSLPSPPPSEPADPPEPERSVSMEARLPESCLDPCVICQSRPKNGCIIHGRTGHLMACYTCARKLKKRNKLCPVCREPIQSVVLTYIG